jgi:DNA invertase Pin-like site-specific DNA recombinase
VTKLNRIASSTRKILNAINLIHEKHACLITLDGAINTSDKNPFSDAMISICDTFSQLDRDLTIDRTTEGREAAKAAGKHMGRAPSLGKEQTNDIIKRLKNSESISLIAKKFNTSRTTIYRIKDKFLVAY